MVGRRLILVPILGIALAGAIGIPATGATASTPATSVASESGPTHQRRAVPQPVAVHEGPNDRKRVALTFDADMTPDMRERLESGEVHTWYNDRHRRAAADGYARHPVPDGTVGTDLPTGRRVAR